MTGREGERGVGGEEGEEREGEREKEWILKLSEKSKLKDLETSSSQAQESPNCGTVTVGILILGILILVPHGHYFPLS